MPTQTLDFETDVVEKSRETPVVVDFWADWCQPCHMLAPRLESLAEEQYGGAWSLVKVNTEEHPELAQRYGVRGLPTVKLFHDGEPVDEFTGALPERGIQQWLDGALPTEEKARLERARTALAEGDHGAAELLLRAALEDDPGNTEAQVLLAHALVFDSPQEAADLSEDAHPTDPDLRQTNEAVETVARLLTLSGEKGGTLPPEPPARYLRAVDALTRKDFDAALEHFIEVVRADRGYDDDGARRACVALFTLLGPEHAAVQKHRSIFDRALY